MKIINRFLGRSFIANTLIVCLLLVGLFTLLEFVSQLDDVGEGRYRLFDALAYVALTIPGRIMEMIPVSALLGSIISLGMLVESQEMVALKAGGISHRKIAWAILQPGLLLGLVLLLAAQFVNPSLEQAGWIRREQAISQAGTMLPRGGFWTRTEEGFTAVHAAAPGGTLQGIDLYRFDGEGALDRRIHARRAKVLREGRWRLEDVLVQTISAQGAIAAESYPELTMERLLTGKQVRIFGLPPDFLSLSDLYRFIRSLEEQRQNAARYRLAFWQKLNLPLSMAAMIVLSFPFALGPPRGASLGWRIMVGAVTGLAYYYLHNVLAYTALLLEWSPVLITLVPTLLVLAAGGLAVRRLN